MLVCVSLPLVTWFDSSLSAWSNSLFFHPLIDARLASVSTLISRLDFHFWRVDRFSFFGGWLACSLFRVISFDHMYFPTWWFSLVDGFHWLMVFRRFWQLVNFLSADDDDDDDDSVEFCLDRVISIRSPEFYFDWWLLFSVFSPSIPSIRLSVFVRWLSSVSRLYLYSPSRSDVEGLVILVFWRFYFRW